MKRSYRELIRLPTMEERFHYLQIAQQVGVETFGFDRYLNQRLYHSLEWKSIRHQIVIRDNGCDLAMDGYPVGDRGIIHHINPITLDQLTHGDDSIFDPDNLILCSWNTHQAIHYGTIEQIITKPIERRPGDTCPWR